MASNNTLPFEIFKSYYRPKIYIHPAIFVLVPNKPIDIRNEFSIRGKTTEKVFQKGSTGSKDSEVGIFVKGAKEIMLEDLKWQPLQK